MNTHNQINELLVSFALGELNETQRQSVEKHLADCPLCKNELKNILALLEATEQIQSKSADEKLCESAKNTLFASIKEAKPSQSIRKSFWRIIMKSPITKLAAAAMIIIAVLIVINKFDGSIDGTTPTFAQSVEAMKKMPWLHQISRGFERG